MIVHINAIFFTGIVTRVNIAKQVSHTFAKPPSLWKLIFSQWQDFYPLSFINLDSAKNYENNEEPISFTCDGDCKNDNVTIQINAYSNNAWQRYYESITNSFTLNNYFINDLLDERVSNEISKNCGCKEEIQYKSKVAKCRVWECFFKDDNFLEHNHLVDNVFTFPYLTDRYFTVSVYLQGAKSIFRGGNDFFFNILEKSNYNSLVICI